jgi:hypothetical protein
MMARAIALGERVAYMAPDPANYVRADVTAGAFNDPVHTLTRAAGLFGTDPGVLLVRAGNELLRAWNGARDQLADAGWSCTDVKPWTTWKHTQHPTVHVGALAAIDYDRTPLFGPDDRPSDVVRRLAWAEQAIGAPYHMTPGVTGHSAIRSHYAQTRRTTAPQRPGVLREPYWGVGSSRDHEDKRNGSGDLIWGRRALRTDTAMGWVHSYDLNAARLAATGVAELGWGKLKRADSPAFEPRQAGYWLVHAHEIAEPFPGAIYDRADVVAGMVWLTTPMMEFLSGLGMLPVPVEAWTATGRRILRPMAEKWNAARLAAPRGPGLETIKAVYREAAGLLAHNGGSIVRHDWYHTIMDRQRATLLSHILRVKRTTGLLPLVVHTDCLWYPSEDEDPNRTADRLGLRLGTGLGAFRVHTSASAGAFYKKR